MENLPVVLSNEMQNEINVYASKVIAEMPKVIDNEQNTIYVPVAGVDYPGIAFFNSKHFSIDLYGYVSLLKGGIEKIEKIKTEDGVDTWGVFLTDGRVEYFTIENGAPGTPGYTPEFRVTEDYDLEVSYNKGEWKSLGKLPSGAQGPQGPQGPKPERGVDYYTEEDKAEIINGVLSSLPFAEEVSV
jgi:hypothetical protein